MSETNTPAAISKPADCSEALGSQTLFSENGVCVHKRSCSVAVPSDPVRMVDLDSQVAHVREVGRLFRGPCPGTAASNQRAEKAGGGGGWPAFRWTQVVCDPTHDKVGSSETLASANEVLGVPPKAPAKAELHDKNVKSESQCHADGDVFGSDMALELENQ